MDYLINQHPVFKIVPEPGNVHQPIELILADHYRHRLVAQQLLDLSEKPEQPGGAENAAMIRYYLTTEFLQHEEFEEEDFVPMLKRRCLPEDNLDNLLAILVWDHFIDTDSAGMVNGALALLAKGRQLADADMFKASARRFATNLSAHIIWENRAILPLAKRRLRPDDLAELGENAIDRRRKNLWPQMYADAPQGFMGSQSQSC